MVSDSWFRSLWKTPKKQEGVQQKVVIGVLAFEVASLMAKLVHLWQSLSDKHIARLRDDITNSAGIKKVVSDDDEYIVGLIRSEMIANMTHVAKSVARLGKKCNDPSLKGFEHSFDDLVQFGYDPCGWIYTWKKMESKVKKMERFVATNATLYQETEMLADLEQTLRRMKSNDDSICSALVEFQKKITWKKHEVKNLREISLWNKTYDYIVLLLARSLFTIFSRIKNVFGIQQIVDTDEVNGSRVLSQPVPSLMRTMINSENRLARYASGPLRRFATKLGPLPKKNKPSMFNSGPLGQALTKSGPISEHYRDVDFHSGPLGGSSTKSGPISASKKNVSFYSGPLEKLASRSGSVSGSDRASKNMGLVQGRPSNAKGKKAHQKPNRLTQVGPFKGCMMSDNISPVVNSHVNLNGIEIVNGGRDSSADFVDNDADDRSKSILDSKHKLLDAPPETLGAAALALHYANVIIVIEKLAASPHLIGLDARDDLYNMLPKNVRAALREKLKPYTKKMASSVYDTVLAGEWNDAITSILEWLGPLAHNMIRWQSERSFEQQNLVSKTNVLLVQTLFFANQEKTEAIITELLVGLNYIWRYGRELNAKALIECGSSRTYDEYLNMGG